MKALVLGVTFMDIKGYPFYKYDAVGTNKGRVITCQGGAARNVAEDLAHLGVKVSFPAMLDKDPFGEALASRLLEAGIDISDAPRTEKDGTGMWLAVFNEKGDLAGSISKMPDVAPLEELLDKEGERLISGCDVVIAEFDTSERIARRTAALARRYGKPLYVIVGNMTGVLACRDLIPQVDCLIMNEIEAGKLFSLDLTNCEISDTEALLRHEADRLGLDRYIVTLGAQGCVYSDSSAGISGRMPSLAETVVDTTGAGDAFFSAAVIALSKGLGVDKAALLGSKLSARVLATLESACPEVESGFFDLA